MGNKEIKKMLWMVVNTMKEICGLLERRVPGKDGAL